VSRQEGATYRLLTEQEWEAAARGGESYAYAGSDDLNAVGWYSDNSGRRTHAVCEKARNAYGLCDMSGNVWEWTSTQSGSGRVERGGSWNNVASDCRVANRFNGVPANRFNNLGFRLARTSP
jgi:formylglycine-generating enzyme required for sulfatase activity